MFLEQFYTYTADHQTFLFRINNLVNNNPMLTIYPIFLVVFTALFPLCSAPNRNEVPAAAKAATTSPTGLTAYDTLAV